MAVPHENEEIRLKVLMKSPQRHQVISQSALAGSDLMTGN
jgi:hypothetical protein